jgi:hypothetical protein
MKFLLIVSLIIGCFGDQRCYKGRDKTNDEFHLSLNNDHTFEMIVLSKFHDESNLFKVNGTFSETNSTIILDKYFDDKSVKLKKYGNRKIKIHFLHEEIELKLCRCSDN